MKKVLLAMTLVALMAMPALASVQNVKVSGDIESTYVVRNQFDLGNTTSSEKYRQNFLMTQTRLRVDADLTDNVQTTVGLINERVWGKDQFNGTVDATSSSTTEPVSSGASGNNQVDINIAYVTLKEMLYSPLTVIVGRQNFAFGNSFVIDSAGTNNNVSTGGLKGVAEDFTKRTAMDAVRLILDYNPLTINAIYAKVSATNVAGTGALKDNIDLWGTNAAYQLGDKFQTLVEGYFWAKLDNSNDVVSSAAGAKADTVYMPGIHVSTNPIKGLNLSAEIAMQRGNDYHSAGVNIKREATAAQLIANYQVPCPKLEKYKPVLTTAYTFVSGEKNSAETGAQNETRSTGWDPMFENQAGGTIYNTMFNLTNAHILTARASAMPIKDVTTTLQWDSLWLDKEVQGGVIPVLRPNGTTLNEPSTTNAYLGTELGVGASFAYTEDVTLGAKFNWFTPGDAFASSNKNTASQVLINANVNF